MASSNEPPEMRDLIERAHIRAARDRNLLALPIVSTVLKPAVKPAPQTLRSLSFPHMAHASRSQSTHPMVDRLIPAHMTHTVTLPAPSHMHTKHRVKRQHLVRLHAHAHALTHRTLQPLLHTKTQTAPSRLYRAPPRALFAAAAPCHVPSYTYSYRAPPHAIAAAAALLCFSLTYSCALSPMYCQQSAC